MLSVKIQVNKSAFETVIVSLVMIRCPLKILDLLHFGKVEINDLIVFDPAKGNEIRTAG